MTTPSSGFHPIGPTNFEGVENQCRGVYHSTFGKRKKDVDSQVFLVGKSCLIQLDRCSKTKYRRQTTKTKLRQTPKLPAELHTLSGGIVGNPTLGGSFRVPREGRDTPPAALCMPAELDGGLIRIQNYFDYWNKNEYTRNEQKADWSDWVGQQKCNQHSSRSQQMWKLFKPPILLHATWSVAQGIFEIFEPRKCPNPQLDSHEAWYKEASDTLKYIEIWEMKIEISMNTIDTCHQAIGKKWYRVWLGSLC